MLLHEGESCIATVTYRILQSRTWKQRIAVLQGYGYCKNENSGLPVLMRLLLERLNWQRVTELFVQVGAGQASFFEQFDFVDEYKGYGVEKARAVGWLPDSCQVKSRIMECYRRDFISEATTPTRYPQQQHSMELQSFMDSLKTMQLEKLFEHLL